VVFMCCFKAIVHTLYIYIYVISNIVYIYILCHYDIRLDCFKILKIYVYFIAYYILLYECNWYDTVASHFNPQLHPQEVNVFALHKCGKTVSTLDV
jgi:hypothetical protein